MRRAAATLALIACNADTTGDESGNTSVVTTPTPTDTPSSTSTDACPPADPADNATATQDGAPFVVCTVPAAGDQAVDPALTELVAYFSEKMQDGDFSWVQTDAGTPPDYTGDISFDADGRTNRVGVALEPDTDYVAWINDPYGTYSAFQDESGNRAIPYELSFHTASP